MITTITADALANGAQPGRMRISVVIPHLNQPEALGRCLASLANGVRRADQIIVVDNGSTILPQAICAGHRDVELLAEAVPGPGPARNRGVMAATGDIFAFIDADCLADAAWLAEAEAAMTDPEAVILGGDVRIALENPDRVTMLEAYESVYAYRMDRYIAREGFTGTGNLVVRRSVMQAVGPFAGLSVAEDRDWGLRATGMGFKIIYVAAMKVYHPARRSFAELAVKWDRHSAHDFMAATARRGGRLKFAAKTLVMAVSPLAEVPRVLASDRISGLRSRMLALLCLWRIRAYRARVMAGLLVRGGADRLSGAWNR
jgi:glycosyltransferase involved in cell wall biosynthesis